MNTNVNNAYHMNKNIFSKNYLCYVFIVFSLAQITTKILSNKICGKVLSCQNTKSKKVSVPRMKGLSMHVWLTVCFCPVAYMV